MRKNIVISWPLFVLILLLVIPLINLLTPGYFLGHDTIDHVVRIANFYANLQEGTFIPRWAGNLNWGYGHPVLIFLYPLPSYTASLFIGLGFSFINATKIVFALGFILSGITMFVWIRSLWGERSGLVAAVLYVYAPYRFVDLYVRGAIGENLFFIWPPLVCYFLHKLIRTQNSIYLVGGSFAVGAMILSHNALSIMFIPFILFYSIIEVLIYSKDKIKTSIFVSFLYILGFGVSSFFWIPAIVEGKYTLREKVIGDDALTHFETMTRLIYSPWNYNGTGVMSVQVGVIQWCLILASIILLTIVIIRYINKKKSKEKKELIFSIALLILCLCLFICVIFVMTKESMWLYQIVPIMKLFQFPWRWLSLALFIPAIIGAQLNHYLPQRLQIWFCIFIIFFSVFLSKNFWHAKEYKELSNSFFTSIYEGTTDTGESAPIWSVRFMEKKPEAYYVLSEGEGVVQEISRKITKHSLIVNSTSEKVRLIDNTLYFPGWNVFIDGKQLPIDQLYFHDPLYRGLINFYVPKGEHAIEITFTNTKIRNFADAISVISLFFLLVLLLFHFVQKAYTNRT